MKKNNNSPIFTLPFFMLSLVNFFTQISFSILSLLPTHLANLGATKTYIGFFMNIPYFGLAVFVLFYTKLTGNIKKKNIIFFGYIISFFSLISMFFIYENLILLLIFRLFSSVSYAFGFVLLFSMAYDIIPENKRIGGIAIYGISGILSHPIGSFLSEKIILLFQVKYLFIAGAIFSLVALLLTPFLLEVEYNISKNGRGIRGFLKKIFERNLFFMIIISIIFGGAFGIFSSFIPNFSKIRLGAANLSLFFLAFSIITIIARVFVFKFIDSIPVKFLILFTLLSIFISMFYLLFLKNLWQLFLIGFIYGSAHSILYPLLSSYFVNKSQIDEEKTLFNNLFLIAFTTGSVGLPTLLGIVGDFFGILSIFITMLVFVFFIIIAVFFKKKF